jgi:hypothetical protein
VAVEAVHQQQERLVKAQELVLVEMDNYQQLLAPQAQLTLEAAAAVPMMLRRLRAVTGVAGLVGLLLVVQVRLALLILAVAAVAVQEAVQVVTARLAVQALLFLNIQTHLL